jgi:hypothetical protein
MQLQWINKFRKYFHRWTTGEVVFTLFILLLSFQIPIISGTSLGFSCVEIFVFIALSLYLVNPRRAYSVSRVWKMDPMMRVLIGWSVWGIIVWAVSSNWKYGINETRWIFLSAVAYYFLRVIFNTGWEQKIKIFLLVSVGIALITDLQGLAGIFLPPFTALPEKEFFLSLNGGITHAVAVGFFKHPNAFGGFIYWPMLLSLGLVMKNTTRKWGMIGFLFFGFSLFLSDYRTLLLGAMLAIVLFALLMVKFSQRQWTLLLSGVSVFSILGFVVFYLANSASHFFVTFTGRVLLWISVFPIVTFSMQTLLLGIGGALPVGIFTGLGAVDPHNAYLYMLVHYGLPGLIILASIIGIVVHHGWKANRMGVFQANPVAGALWIGLLVWFITSFADSRLTTPEWQFQFVFLLALFMAIPMGEVEGNNSPG